jgi:hypothetical protein
VPSVFYNGDGWVGIRRYLLEEATIERFYGFENREKIFPIDSRYKFVNLVVRKTPPDGEFTAAFMRHDVAELDSDGSKPWQVRISRAEIERLSPETLAFLEYRSPRDQQIVHKMAAGRPTLGGDGPGNWGVRLFTDLAHDLIYNSARDKDLFTDPASGRLYTPYSVLGAEPADFDEALERMRERGFWPVFEGKHIDQFVVGIKPVRWWLSVERAEQKYGKPPRAEPTLVFRQIASNTNERTCIAAALPAFSVGTETLTGVSAAHIDGSRVISVLNSLCFDFMLRLRVAGSHVTFSHILPMPVPPALASTSLPAVERRVAWRDGIEHIAGDRESWATLWNANRAVAEAYGLGADDFAHILAAFPGFARKRVALHAYFMERLNDWRAGRD